MAICPNFNDKTTKQEFGKLVVHLGENLAYETWNSNGGYEISKAVNGKESILYHQLFKYTGSHEMALKIKAMALRDGGFDSDVNGEPLFPEVLKKYNVISKKLGIFEKSVDKRMAKQFINHFKRLFPTIDIVEESDSTTESKTGNKEAKGWVDNEVVHFNVDRVTTDTFVHELGHILEPVLKNKYPKVYSELEKHAQKAMSDSTNMLYPLYVSIRSNRASNGLPITESNMLSEMIANMLGFTSERKILDIMKRDTNSLGIFNSISLLMNNVSTSLKDFFGYDRFDSGSTKVNDILSNLVDDILNGKIVSLSVDEKTDLITNLKQSSTKEVYGVEKEMHNIFGKTISDKIIALNNGHTLDKNKDGSVNEKFNSDVNSEGVNAAIKIQFSAGNVFNVKVTNAVPTDEDLNDAIRNQAAADYEYDPNTYESKYQEKYKEPGAYKPPKETPYSGIKIEDLKSKEDNSKQRLSGITNLSELNKALMGDKYLQEDVDLLTEDLTNRIILNSADKNFNEIWYNGNLYQYSKSLPISELKDNVNKDIASVMITRKTQLKNDLVEKYKFDRNKTIEQNLTDMFDKEMSNENIRRFMRFTGLTDHVQLFVKYSDLKNISDPNINKLYDERLVGHDPLVLIHGINSVTGEIDMSLVDISTNSSTFSPAVGEGRHILRNYMKDKDYTLDNGSMLASETDVRTMNLGVAMLHMNKVSGNKVRYRNIGVVHITKNQVTPRLLFGTNQLMENIALFAKNEALKKDFKDNYILDLMGDEKLLQSNYNQSFIAQVKSYLVDVISSGDIQQQAVAKLQLATFLDPTSTKDNIQDLFKAMKDYRAKNITGNKEDDQLYKLLSAADIELRTGHRTFLNSLKDISKFERYITTALGQKNELVQGIVNAVKQATFRITEDSANEINALKTLKSKDGKRNLLEAVMKEHISFGSEFSARVFADRGSKYFAHMYKTVKVNDGSKTVEIPILKLHNTLNDADTKALYDRGIISEDDLQLANYILDKQQEYWIKLIEHIETNNAKRTSTGMIDKVAVREAAERVYFSNFSRGDIVGVQKGSGELMGDLNVKGSLNRTISEITTNSENFFQGIQNEDLKETYDFFYKQRKLDERLAYAGLQLNGNQLELLPNGIETNKALSLNLFHTASYFTLAANRKMVFDNEVMPLVEDVETMLKSIESFKGGKEFASNNLQWIHSYIKKTINRANDDDDTILNKVKTPFGEVNVAGAVRVLASGYRMAVLPWRFTIGVWSLVYNTNRLFTESLAAKMANADTIVPTIGNMTSAMLEVAKGNYRLHQKLALKNHVYNRTERDLLSNPFVDPTKKFLFQDQYSNIFNWATDTASRTAVMVAVMKQDGSYNAYSLDKTTQELVYDETKDQRFYANGKRREDPQSIAEYNRIKYELIRNGQMKETDTKLTTGYDRIAAENMKYISDKYVIGSMDDTSKNIFTNNFLGQISAQFRMFSFERLQNAGLFGGKRMTTVGQRAKAIQLDNGEWISQREAIEWEGMYQSLVETGKMIKKFGLLSPKEFSNWFDNQSDQRRYNLSKFLIQSVMFALFLGIGTAIDDDDEEDKKMARTFSKLLSDMTVFSIVGDYITNPIPIVDFMSNVFNRGEFYKLLPSSGAANEYFGVQELLEDNEENN